MKRNANILLSNPKYRLKHDYWANTINNMDIDYMIKPRIDSKNEPSHKYKEFNNLIDEDTFKKVVKITKNSDITLYILMLTVFTCTLHKYTNKDDIYFGIPEYDKNFDDAFNDLLLYRNIIDKNKSFKETLIDVKNKFIEICENKDYPISNVFEEMNENKKDSYEIIENIIFASNSIHDIKRMSNISNNKLLIIVDNGNDNIKLNFMYSSKYFDTDVIDRLCDIYKRILCTAVNNIEIKIDEIDILSEEERNKILYDFNNTKIEFERAKTIHSIFEEQVRKNPDRTALVCEDKSLTFKELNRKANRVANILRKKGVSNNNVVGLMTDRSSEMIIGILGILKAGGAYLPIDYKLPQDRILSMLYDGNVNIILTKGDIIDTKSFTSLQGLSTAKVKTFKTEIRKTIMNLDELPIIDRSLVDYERYHKHIGLTMVKSGITLQATRGCPYNCSYCHKIWSKTHVVRSAENIYKEVKLYYDMGVRRFSFIDDIFNLDVENSSRFFKMIIDNNLHIQIFFPAGLRGDILTKDYIDLMVKAGTVNIAVALETASYRLQKIIHKNLNIDRLFENLKYLCETYPHVITELFTMHGFPTESKEEALNTLDFIKKIKWIHFPYIHILKIYNNTEMEQLALKSGISQDAINRSMELAWQELPETLPFEKSFTIQYQSRFLNEYFLSKERLLSVLPYEMKIMTESELIEKYSSYMPIKINTLDDLLSFVDIKREELGDCKCVEESSLIIPDLNKKMKMHFEKTVATNNKDKLKILFLDLSQYFEGEANSHYDPIEPPLGHMYLLSYLNSKLGDKIEGRIAKSKMDFANYEELKKLLNEFKPNVIGVRSLNYYRNFFHKTISIIREWGIDIPIIAGGPYATSMSEEVLCDKNIDIASLGEGEFTFLEIINKIIEAKGNIPSDDILKDINGIAFIPAEEREKNEYAREIIMMDNIYDDNRSEYDEYFPDINMSSDAAYAIFTSGSTGKPKGILVEHKNVINLVFGLREKIYKRYEDNMNVALAAPYVFDASVQQIFASLLLGNTLFVVPDHIRKNGEALINYYIKNNIDISDGTPAHIALMAGVGGNDLQKINVRHFIIGGEALPSAIVKKFFNLFKEDSPIITNVYGPTECCVDSTYFDISKNNIDSLNDIPIGYPMSNVKIFVINKDEKLLPIGVEGEICIAGSGVARGYLNNNELTSSRFMENPLICDERIYKTGDRGKWLKDGSLYYIDRMDNQVKIRGYRIELGEIQNQLLKHPEIMEATVVIREDDNNVYIDRYLCAYVVLKNHVETEDLRKYLLFYLPDYMVPQYYVIMDSLPKTNNEKSDIRSLPDPKKINKGNNDHLVKPRNTVEKKLVECYKKVLSRNNIGIKENFFTIGGDSIKTIQIISRMKKYGYKVDMNDIFDHATIEELAPFVTKIEHISDQSAVTGEVPLTPIQRNFFNMSNIDTNHFNQSIMLDCNKHLDKDLLVKIFDKLQEHHDALRMTFNVQNGEVKQRFMEIDLPVSVDEFDFQSEDEYKEHFEKIVNKIQQGIDLKTGPLMKLGLFHFIDMDRLLIVIHHLVVDGVSWRILSEDIETLFNQCIVNEDLVLPDKTDSYKEWAERIIDYSKSDELLKESKYWSDVIHASKKIPVIEKDNYCEYYLRDRKVINIDLSEEDTNNLLNNVNQAFGTDINDILLTALGLSVRDTFDNTKILVEMEGHGREDIIDGLDINRTVGWFTSLFPVILDLSYKNNLSRQIKEVKEMFRKIPKKGIGYNILRNISDLNDEYKSSFSYKPQICFNYLGQVDESIACSSFKLSDEYTGETQSLNRKASYELDINCIVKYNKLRISLAYCKNQFSYEKMNLLLENYREELAKIIRFCMDCKDTEITPSDLGYKDISIEQFENFFE